MDESLNGENGVVAEPSPKPRVWTVFLVLFAIVAWVVFASIAFVFISALIMYGLPGASAHVDAILQSDIGILGSTLCTMFIFAGGAMLAAWLSPIPFVDRLRLRPPAISPFGMAAAICGTLAISLAFDGLSQLNMLPESPMLTELSKVLGSMTGFALIGAVLTIGVAPGIAEELLFRGYIQTRLTRRWGAGVSITITALLFGLMHMDLVHGGFAVVMGLFLGYLTERSGSIRPAMVCHATNNIISTLTASSDGAAIGAEWPGLLLVVACVLLVLCTIYLRLFVSPRADEPAT